MKIKFKRVFGKYGFLERVLNCFRLVTHACSDCREQVNSKEICKCGCPGGDYGRTLGYELRWFFLNK